MKNDTTETIVSVHPRDKSLARHHIRTMSDQARTGTGGSDQDHPHLVMDRLSGRSIPALLELPDSVLEVLDERRQLIYGFAGYRGHLLILDIIVVAVLIDGMTNKVL